MRIYEGNLVLRGDVLVSYQTSHYFLPFGPAGGIAATGAGGETSPASVATFTAATQHPADLAVTFFNPFSWTEFNDSIPYTFGIWNGYNGSWSVPLVPTGGTFAEVINGSRDGIFISCANAMRNATPPGMKIITRIGWEFNGNWFGWSAGGQETNFINAFNHVVGIFRNISSQFVFDLCVSIISVGPACDIDAIFNGVRQNLTFLSNDIYFSSGDTTASGGSAAFGFHRDKTWGLTATRATAIANGLFYAIPECAGPDSVPNYGSELLEWIYDNQPAYWAWWEGDHGPLNMRLATGVNPLMLAEYKLRFGLPQITTSASQSSAQNVNAVIALTTAYAQTNTWTVVSGTASIVGSTLTIPGAPAGVVNVTVRATNQWGMSSDLAITQTFVAAYTMTDADAAAWVARRTATASESLKQDIDNLYIALKAAGAYSIAKEMWIAVDTEEASKFGMKGSVDRVPTNSPAFTPYNGFTGSGSAYVDLVAASSATPYTRNSAWVMIWQIANLSSASPAIGINGSGAMELVPRNGSGNATLVMNDFSTMSVANASAPGIYSGIRSASAARRLRKNGVTIVSDTTVSAYTPTTAHFIEDASNMAFPAAHQLRFVLIGSAPSDGVEAATVSALQAWATARGVGGPASYSMPATTRAYGIAGQAVTLTKTTVGGGAWPDATNTGTTGTLTAHSGDLYTSSNGQIIQNLNVTGTIQVNHSGVTVRNCRCYLIGMVDGNGNPSGGSNCLIEDCTIIGNGVMQMTGIQAGSAGIMVRRCNVSGVENGINVEGINGGTIRDCYVHDNASPGNSDPHYDGIVVQGGQSNILIEHNYVTGTGLSAVMFIQADFGSISNITVNNNKFIGGGYTCYSYAKNAAVSGSIFTNNRMDGWVYGPLFGPATVMTWTGNVVDSTGAAIAGP